MPEESRYLAAPQHNRSVAVPPTFDPARGTTVIEPLGAGSGWWVGAPSVFWDGHHYYLSYRVRRPQPERGGETRIAISDDGRQFETIWVGRKEQFASPSIERSALLRTPTGQWRLYISYVDGVDGRWRIDLLEAAAPDRFDPAQRREVLTAAAIGAEGVKDPWVCYLGGEWVMLTSFAPTPGALAADPTSQQQLHGTKDVYNTGLSKSLSGLATSHDGLHWTWQGAILAPQEAGWDCYAARLNTAVWLPPLWVGYYDGSASVAENYEERCGLATSPDLRAWRRISPVQPTIGAAAPGPGAVRYVEAVQGDRWIRFYYEWTRPDGAHELRTSLVSLT